MIYDISNKRTFEEIQFWVRDCEDFAPDAVKFLIGNKCDLLIR